MYISDIKNSYIKIAPTGGFPTLEEHDVHSNDVQTCTFSYNTYFIYLQRYTQDNNAGPQLEVFKNL